jgi:hypothetical protein
MLKIYYNEMNFGLRLKQGLDNTLFRKGNQSLFINIGFTDNSGRRGYLCTSYG